MRFSKAMRIALSLILALAASLAGAAQPDSTVDQFPASSRPDGSQPDASEPSVETLQIYSREIVVDVMVTDAKGNPVRGLKQSDFTIEENGKPQPMRSFGEFSLASQTAQPAAPRLPPGVYTNSQQMPVRGPVNIFLLDALHTQQFDMVHALQDITQYLTNMPQGTQVAVFWLSESGLHLLQGFTPDRGALLRAVNTDRIDFGSLGDRNSRNWTTFQALDQIAAYVSGIKGRKNLLWVTPGMPVNLMRDGGYGWLDGPSDMAMVHHLMDTYEMLTAAQVAVCPIDPRGVIGLGMAQLKAEAVAEDTGGEAFYNDNDLKPAIAKAIDDGSHFYSLSYIPPSKKDDGHYHHIDVKVDQPDLHLVFRKGYNAERAPTINEPAPGPALMKAAMEGNAPAATQILFDAGVWPSTQAAAAPVGAQAKKASKVKVAALTRYEIHYGFPANEIAFAVQPDGSLHGALEFDAVAYDINRTRLALLTQTVEMPLRVDQYDGFAAKAFQFVQQIDLPPGQITLRLGILDKVNNKVGVLEIPLLVSPGNLAQRANQSSAPCPPRCRLPHPAPALANSR